jgi:hypothetical protein
MFLGPLLLLGLLVALAHSRRPALGLVGGTTLLVVLLVVMDYRSERTAFWYLTSPGITTFLDVIGPGLGSGARAVGWPNASVYVLMAMLTVVLAAAGAFAMLRLRRVSALALFGGLTFAFCAAVTGHAFLRVLYGANGGPGLGGGSRTNADWIDQRVPEHESASLLARQLGQLADSRQRWWTTEFWNRKVTRSYVLGAPAYTYNAPRDARVATSNGRITTDAGRTKYVVASTSGVPLAPMGRRLSSSPDGRLELLAPTDPLRARWAVFPTTGGLRHGDPPPSRSTTGPRDRTNADRSSWRSQCPVEPRRRAH